MYIRFYMLFCFRENRFNLFRISNDEAGDPSSELGCGRQSRKRARVNDTLVVLEKHQRMGR